ncbi:hypothetical protein [Ktedonobacter robiniae]|uniref:Threonine dehydratase n=1 Tax=Ktedonobacter robiniae TaxID=2778365 RepID=A0ABQ3V733_9CHLR|nr:hypothetical protein [Ktedonobacter robiniae]GHO60781.1 hypothetical protein KSB_92560 [Ktedonobacter robiniae]
MIHTIHDEHTHRHSEHCGHTAISHAGHTDYLHDGHLHHLHAEHYDEHTIEVDAQHPATCSPVICECGHNACGHEKVPHGDHFDYLYNGVLHHPHGDHCDQHGSVQVQ